ncbi:MAG: hypothetical protein ABIQ78_03720 [Dokdonella sp.]
MSLDRVALEGAKKALRIYDVYFRDEEVTILPELIPQFEFPGDGRVQFKMSTRLLHDFERASESAGDGKPERFVEIEFKGSVRIAVGTDDSEDFRSLVRMDLSLGLLYSMKHECSAESLSEFIRANAPYHAIPYWREHVHCVCAKRRIPLVTVPMYTKLPPLEVGTEELEIK